MNASQPQRGGVKKAADFQLVQKDAHAIDVTVWGDKVELLSKYLGKYIALFDLEVRAQGKARCTVETSWNFRVEELHDIDSEMRTFQEKGDEGDPRQGIDNGDN